MRSELDPTFELDNKPEARSYSNEAMTAIAISNIEHNSELLDMVAEKLGYKYNEDTDKFYEL